MKNHTAISLIISLLFWIHLNNHSLAQPVFPAPNEDNWQPNVSATKNKPVGAVLATRKVRLLRIPDLHTTQIAYKSLDAFGKPIVATTTVVQPAHVKTNSPILSLQHFINGLGTRCNPSYVLIHNANFDVWWDLTIPALIYQFVKIQKWTVSIPDHLGPQMVYPGGMISGHVVLDGLRAIKNHFNNYNKSRITLLGYSGGGISTGWAAAVAHRYAPELNIVGAAQGGVPVDLIQLFKIASLHLHEHSPALGIIFAAALGIERQYPELNITNRLNQKGKKFQNAIINACVDKITSLGTKYTISELLPKGINIWREDLKPLKELSLLYQNLAPHFPIFQFHSRKDELLPYNSVINLVKKYCRAGTPLQFRALTIPEHVLAIPQAIPEVIKFLIDRAAGVKFHSECNKFSGKAGIK